MAAKKQRRNGTAGGADGRAGQTSRYLALHGTELARALAAGALAPVAGNERLARLGFVGNHELAGALAAARDGRDYGVVALVEVAQERIGRLAGEHGDAGAGLAYVPLAAVSRIVFGSGQDLEEFRARASGYQDVPADVLEYHVDPGLFSPGAVQQALDLPGAGSQPSEPASGTLAGAMSVDKLAGAIAACISAGMRRQAEPSLLGAVAAACGAAAPAKAPGAFVRALAARLDPSPEAAVQATLAGTFADALAAMAPASGFDAEGFLEGAAELSKPGSDEAVFAAKFTDWAKAVLSGSHEVADDGFSNHPGKTVSRALLLFLLNPDPSRIQAMGKRMGEFGASVDVLASTMAGYLVGYASLPVAIKAADTQRYLAIPLLARLLAQGEPPGLSTTISYRPDASADHVLSLEGYTLLATRVPPPPLVTELLESLAVLGLGAAFEQASGHLAWDDPASPGILFRAKACEAPVFPRRPAMELYATFDRPRAGGERPSDVAARTKDSGVFAYPARKGSSRVMQLGVICDDAGTASVRAALLALSSATASAIGAIGNEKAADIAGE